MSEKNDIQQGLEQNAQVIQERLPEHPTPADIEQVRAALRLFMADNGFSQAKVAAWIGYSKTVVTEFLSGRYKGSNERLAKKIVNLINDAHRKQRRTRNRAFISTTVARRIGALIRQVQAFSEGEGKIGLVVGDGGHGKSHCLRQFAKADLNTVYVCLDDTMGATKIFAEIAKSLKVDPSGSLAAIAERLVEVLAVRHVVILLDEASGLRVRQLNQLRQIVVVKGCCPLVLAGNRNLLDTAEQSSTRRGCEALDQFASRLVQVLNLDELAGSRDDDLYTVQDVRELYEFGGVRLTTRAVAALRQIAKAPQTGRLRTCAMVVEALHTSAAVVERGLIDAEDILGAIEELQLPVQHHLPWAMGLGDLSGEFESVAVAAG